MIKTDLLNAPNINHGFFERAGGYSTGLFASLNCGMGSGDDQETVARNRAVVADDFNVAPDHLVTAFQIHSASVVVVREPIGFGERPKADGLVCATKGIAIGVLTADCAPILFADASADVVGAAHAGWKGALSGITDETVIAMERLGARREHICAVIGPTISQTNYEVGPGFADPFLMADADAAQFFTKSVKENYYMFDLPGYLVRKLRKFGIEKVVSLDFCTYSDESRFFSYRRATHRREPDYGRMISAISLQ